MLYEKNKQSSLSPSLFANPTAEYRGAPFWAWNCALDIPEALRQAGIFKEMGFGGYHMHVRTGLSTPYLGEEYNACIRACTDYARDNQMLAWLYDEDRWPSGYAGGLATKEKRFRERYLYFTTQTLRDKPVSDNDGRLLEGSRLLARYKIVCPFGKLVSYRRLKDGENPPGIVWKAYLRIEKPESWHNNQTYVDTLYKGAIDRFADITYGAYQKTIGDHFGKTVPAIFTDEPQLNRTRNRKFSCSLLPVKKPWTDDFEETYAKTYGESILDKLPEIFWETSKGFSQARYRYYDHLTERFAQAYADNLGKRCEKMDICLTGHLMEEPRLKSQIVSLGEAMRHYRGFQIPGIDMLCSYYEFTTAKQAQSAARQYGREGVLSELYGVSRWDCDFRSYKIQGDWQAALGITIRVPHLSMMSMRGEAKRDYPASIQYQSPWYKRFSIVEDHFARINTAMTRGKPLTEIAVIHPIESYWMQYGPSDKTLCARLFADKRFADITGWLLRNGLDFDYIAESLLPSLNEKGGFPLIVGEMQYKTVIVPDCLTLRSSTLERLRAFARAGGKLIFVGRVPQYMDGAPSSSPANLAATVMRIPFKKCALLSALEDNRLVGIYGKDGRHTDIYIAQLRQDGESLWLFVSRANLHRFEEENKVEEQALTIQVRGEWKTEVWNTMDGTIAAIPSRTENGKTHIHASLYNHDSLLLRLDKGIDGSSIPAKHAVIKSAIATKTEDCVPYTMSEPNALLLDRARYSLDGGPYSRFPHNILHLDNACRKKLGLRLRKGSVCQPWAAEKKPFSHTLRLKFYINSEIDYPDPVLALEDSENTKITWNGAAVTSVPDGFYVDKAIKKVALPPLKKGVNTLELQMPYGENAEPEWCYLLGSFGVRVSGARTTITALPDALCFGPLYKQGLPFYGGKLVYHTSFMADGRTVTLTVPAYHSGLVEAEACGVHKDIVFAPYTAELPSKQGRTPLDLTVYASRQNAFGTPHCPGTRCKGFFLTPHSYRIPSRRKYILCDEGILETPIIRASEDA
jgi:hypothetical protein